VQALKVELREIRCEMRYLRARADGEAPTPCR
jgi:hypothetical protein